MSNQLSIISCQLYCITYANFSLGEAFAESFALFRLDPDALIRIDPKMYQWFEDEGHLQIMQAALPTEPPEIRYVRE